MIKHLTHLVALALAAAVLPALAAEDTPEKSQEADWHARLERAGELKADGAERKEAAKKRLAEQQALCANKFLVNDCRNRAQQEYVTATREGMKIENEGKAIERAVTREQLAERDRRTAAEAQQHAADLKNRERQVSAAHDADDARREAILVRKAARAEEGARRKAEEAKRLQQRQAEHAARIKAKEADAER